MALSIRKPCVAAVLVLCTAVLALGSSDDDWPGVEEREVQADDWTEADWVALQGWMDAGDYATSSRWRWSQKVVLMRCIDESRCRDARPAPCCVDGDKEYRNFCYARCYGYKPSQRLPGKCGQPSPKPSPTPSPVPSPIQQGPACGRSNCPVGYQCCSYMDGNYTSCCPNTTVCCGDRCCSGSFTCSLKYKRDKVKGKCEAPKPSPVPSPIPSPVAATPSPVPSPVGPKCGHSYCPAGYQCCSYKHGYTSCCPSERKCCGDKCCSGYEQCYLQYTYHGVRGKCKVPKPSPAPSPVAATPSPVPSPVPSPIPSPVPSPVRPSNRCGKKRCRAGYKCCSYLGGRVTTCCAKSRTCCGTVCCAKGYKCKLTTYNSKLWKKVSGKCLRVKTKRPTKKPPTKKPCSSCTKGGKA